MVYLNDANNWTYTIEVPKYDEETGLEINYTWTEQDVLGYKRSNIVKNGNTTTFTNTYRSVAPPTPHL